MLGVKRHLWILCSHATEALAWTCCTCLQLHLQLCPLALLRIEDLQVLIQFCLSMVLLLLLQAKGELKVHPHSVDSACCHEALCKGFEH